MAELSGTGGKHTELFSSTRSEYPRGHVSVSPVTLLFTLDCLPPPLGCRSKSIVQSVYRCPQCPEQYIIGLKESTNEWMDFQTKVHSSLALTTRVYVKGWGFRNK